MTRRFVIIGQKATASPEFSLIDIAGTSGRLDILLRCLRSALLVSHGLRRDTIVYLVLLGGPLAPRVLRVDGRHVRFIRPDERMLAILVQKALARSAPDAEPGVFVEIRPGLAVARGGVDAVVFVGDNHGFDEPTRARLAAAGAVPIGVGPISVHADDAITIVCNEMDRRHAASSGAASSRNAGSAGSPPS
jgi:tRNA (pseudouridine54-N1)-methyltransferase